MIIGITGGIATGKTTVLRIFKKNGFKILNLDFLIKKKMFKNINLLLLINKIFNKKIFFNFVNSKEKIRNFFFNKFRIKKLNFLLRFFIKNEFLKQLRKNKKNNLVVEIPLLFEENYEIYFDKIIVIYTKKKKQLFNLIKRDNISFKLANKMINSQLNIYDKILLSDIIIKNNNNLKMLNFYVEICIKYIKNKFF